MLGIGMERKDRPTTSNAPSRGDGLGRCSAWWSIMTACRATEQLSKRQGNRLAIRIGRIGINNDTGELSRIAGTGCSTQVNQGAIRQHPVIRIGKIAG